jgi:peptidoglycan/LPS O-acetylase OafA/YrhL
MELIEVSTSVAQAQPLAANEKRQTGAEPRRNLAALTSLRFFAALMILCVHSFQGFGIDITFRGQAPATWQGVSCFFVISGFIMVYVHSSLPDFESRVRFWVARLARIWPTHFVSFLAFVLVFPACLMLPDALRNALLNLGMIHSWFLSQPTYSSYNTPSWSLAVEMFFYACFPFLLQNLKTTWKWKLVASLVLALSQIALCTYKIYPHFESFGTAVPPLLNIDPLSRVFEFMLGMAVGLYFLQSNFLSDKSALQTTLWEIFATVLVAASIAMPIWWQSNQHMLYLEPFRGWMHYCGVAPAYGLMVFMMARARGLVSRILEWRPLVFLGEISYSTYLFHYPVLLFFLIHFPKFIARNNLWFVELVWLSAVVAVATVNHKLVEVPARKLIIGLYASTKYARVERAERSKADR